MQFVPLFMDQHVPQYDGVIAGTGYMRDGVAPGGPAFIKDAFGESVSRGGVEEGPVEILNDQLIIAERQVGHCGIGSHIGMDHAGKTHPADGSFHVSACKIIPEKIDQACDSRIGFRKNRSGPECFRIAPVCADEFPAGGKCPRPFFFIAVSMELR